MSARFINVDREAPMLLPLDLRDWVPMRHRLATPAGKAICKLRKQTVEPVFGIIKEAM